MSNTFTFGPFLLSPSTRILRKDGAEMPLGSRAFDILTALVECNGKVLTCRELMAIAWPDLVVEDSNVRVQVANIRRALGCGQDGARYIASVARRGYCFVAEVARTTTEAKAPSLFNFPLPLKGAVGREEAVVELSQAIQDSRLVTVVGGAGVGKTTLAVLVGHGQHDLFQEAIFFVDLSTLDCDEMVAEALACAVGYTSPGAELFPGLLEVLSTRRTLIVLDNCEHLVGAAAALCGRVLEGCSSVSFLATSREALRVSEEFVYLLRPLASPPNTGRLSAQQAMEWPAIQLFMERAREGGVRGGLSDDDAPIVAALCRRLDGNPHVIGLVASRVGTYGIKGVADLLENQFALHWQGRRDACPRQQTVEAMIDWSHNLLTEHDRQVLYRLSVFCGEFPIGAAVAVASDELFSAFQVAEAIGDLVDKSLVAVSSLNDEVQIRLLETTRAYAATRLAKLQGRDEIARRHALYYAQQLCIHVGRQARPESADALTCAPEIGNVRAAMEWAFTSRQDLALAVEISGMAAPLLLELGLFRECKRCCERALKLLPESLRSSSIELGLLESAAITYYSGGDYDGEMTHVVERGLALSRELGDVKSAFQFLAGLHLARMANGRFAESLSVSEEYAAMACAQGGHDEAVIARWMEGSSRHFRGFQRAADDSYGASVELVARHELRPLHYFELKEQVVAGLGMARVKWMRGLPIQGLQLALGAIEESRRHPDSFYLSATLCFPILLGNGLTDLAEKLIQELESVANDYKVAVRSQVVHFLKGLLLHARGSFPAAVVHLRQCLDMLPPPKMSVVRTDALQALAEAQFASGDALAALAAIDEAIDLAEKTDGAFNLADLLRTRVEVMQGLPQGQQEPLEDMLAQSLDCAREQSALGWELRVALSLARFKASQGRPREARALLEEVYARCSEGFETRDLIEVTQALEALCGEPAP
ncbi:winged helix-turn-helix domain-containing protein [Pseudomonas sp. REP124]|uniref:ATP-binding protein n=1 Tax=Pseudomonas sp. REP124 TaxID=2875731 RepID=UPI001CCA4464|nr:winged helix-turn-helix domain-containing protein [Pseudomonas sp. REP124]MBZ9780257.1 winged helix-turn-helix domain-containing protein [Pseudomonas sp. REP124]